MLFPRTEEIILADQYEDVLQTKIKEATQGRRNVTCDIQKMTFATGQEIYVARIVRSVGKILLEGL